MNRTYTIYNKGIKGSLEVDWTPGEEKCTIEVKKIIPKQVIDFPRGQGEHPNRNPFCFVYGEIAIDPAKLIDAEGCEVVTVTGLNLPYVQLKNKLLKRDYESWQWHWSNRPAEEILSKNLEVIKGTW